MFAALCLHGRLAQRLMAAGERAEKLVVQVVAIRENDNRWILQPSIERQPAGVENHRQALARTLRMPHHARPLVSL